MAAQEQTPARGMTCANCHQRIRWIETMGWVHGALGSFNWNEFCDDTEATRAKMSD
jgi:hypothetical protein